MQVFATLKHPSDRNLNEKGELINKAQHQNSLIKPLMDAELKSIRLAPPPAKKKERYTVSIKDLLSLKK